MRDDQGWIITAWAASLQSRPDKIPPQPPSLVLTSLEIGRALADRDGVTFRAQGTCMYPVIRPGDLLHIRSCPAAAVKVGDIAACRGRDHLFSHRVIGTGSQGSRQYIVTRPDRARHGSDAPTFDEDLLGVVVAIRRNGKAAPLTPQTYPWPKRLGLAISCWWLDAQPQLRVRLAHLLAHLQGSAAYRWFSRRWPGLSDQEITFVVRVPLRATDDIYEAVPADKFNLRENRWRGRSLERWLLALHVGGDSRPAAIATLQATPDGWMTQGFQVRLRYRGLSLEERLLRRAQEMGASTTGAAQAPTDDFE